MMFKMVLEINRRARHVEDSSKHFRFTGTRASCQLEAQVEMPSIGFLVEVRSTEHIECDFAIIGEEVNGRYFDS